MFVLHACPGSVQAHTRRLWGPNAPANQPRVALRESGRQDSSASGQRMQLQDLELTCPFSALGCGLKRMSC